MPDKIRRGVQEAVSNLQGAKKKEWVQYAVRLERKHSRPFEQLLEEKGFRASPIIRSLILDWMRKEGAIR